MSLIIYFLRHGETTASQTGGYCGTLDPDLTQAGYQMAEDFADSYKSLPWAAVFSSPLRRAVATAKHLCEAAGIPMQLRDGLKEIAFGHWEGKTPEEVNREFHDDYVRWLADPGGMPLPEGKEESILPDGVRLCLRKLKSKPAERGMSWLSLIRPRFVLCCVPS